jgi:hypothetical protein
MAMAAGQANMQAEKFGETMTRLSDDSASLFNTSFADAFQKIRSGLAGESEPLRAFNVFLSESAVQAKAAQMGYSAMGGTLSEGAKIMARAALIQEGLTVAMGNHATTQRSFNNALKEFEGRIDNISSNIGGGLVPVLNQALNVVNPLLAGFEQMGKEVNRAASSSGLASMFAPINQIIEQMGPNAQVVMNMRNAQGDGSSSLASAASKMNAAADMLQTAARQALDREKSAKDLAAAVDAERTKRGNEKFRNDMLTLGMASTDGKAALPIPMMGGGSMLSKEIVAAIGARTADRNQGTLTEIKGLGQAFAAAIGQQAKGGLGLAEGAVTAIAGKLQEANNRAKLTGGISDVDSFNRDLQSGAMNTERAAEETAKNTGKAIDVLETIRDLIGRGRQGVAGVFS